LVGGVGEVFVEELLAGGAGEFVAFAEGEGEEEFVEGNGWVFVEGLGFGFVGFADADGVDDDVVVFDFGVFAGDGLEFGGGEDAGAAAFHLFEVAEGADVAEEDEDFEGFDVGASGYHVDGDGDAEGGAGAEFADEGIFVGGFAGVLVFGLVGDFFAEVVAAGEDFAGDVDDFLGVGVVFGEDEGFGDEGAAGVEFGGEGGFEGLEDGADLGGVDHGAVELVGGVGEVFVEELLAGGAGEFVAFGDEVAFVDGGAVFGDLGFDAVDVVTDVDFVEDGAFVAVVHDEVLVEVGDGLFGGGGGEADEVGVEVFEDLAPEVVDGAVTFVDDDDVKGFGGDGGVVGDFEGAGGLRIRIRIKIRIRIRIRIKIRIRMGIW